MPSRLPLAGLLALALLPVPAVGQPVGFSRELRRGVDPALTSRVRAERGAAYGGFEASLLPEAGYHTAYRLTLGVRPSFGRTRADLRLDYRLAGLGDPGSSGGSVRLDLSRPLGRRVEIETVFRLDPGASIVAVDNALTLRIAGDFTLTRRSHHELALDGAPVGEPVFELGAARTLGADGTLRAGFRTGADDGFGLRYELRF